jgi:hypothetical protein
LYGPPKFLPFSDVTLYPPFTFLIMTSPPDKCRQRAQHSRARHWINKLDEMCGDTGTFAQAGRDSSRGPRILVARNIAQFPILALFIFLPINQICATVPCANIRPPSDPFPLRPGSSPPVFFSGQRFSPLLRSSTRSLRNSNR